MRGKHVEDIRGRCVMNKVSVVVPGYNVEDYIRECLDSVLGQTLKEIEVVCVNDGSVDGTSQIMHEYEKKDSRVVVVDKPNGGLSSARNAGIKKASGEYLLFLDSDDYLSENALELLYETAIKDRLEDVLYGAESFYESEALREQFSSYETYYDKKKTYDRVYSGRELYRLQLENKDFKPSACLQLVKSSLLKEQGILFYEGILHEDHLFTMQVLNHAKKVRCIEDRLYKRRVREESIMTAAKSFRNAKGYLVSMEEMGKLLSEQQIAFEDEYAKAVRQHMTSLMRSAAKCLESLSEGELEENLKDLPYEKRMLFYFTIENTKQLYVSVGKKNTKLKKQSDKIAKQSDKIAKQSEKIEKLTKELENIKGSKSYKMANKLSGLLPGNKE